MRTVRADIEFGVGRSEWSVCLGVRQISELLRNLGLPRTGELAEGLALELVRNAVKHTPDEPGVRVTVADRVRVEVSDSIPVPVKPVREDGPLGLAYLDATADAWGCELTEAGKTVWFDLSWRGRD